MSKQRTDGTQQKSEDLTLIENAFNALENKKDRFLENERACKSQYQKGTDGETSRTSKQKASERKRSRLYVPLTATTVDIIHALWQTSFLGTTCPIEVNSIGQRFGHDERVKNFLIAATKKAWAKPGHKVGLSKAVLCAISQPIGHVALFYDKSRKENRTLYIPPLDLAYDELASDIYDTEHACWKYKKSVREFEDGIASGFYTNYEKTTIYPSSSAANVRIKMKDIYKRSVENGKERWKLFTYANDNLVRKVTFLRSPFHSGYCLEALPSIDSDERENEINVLGRSVPELVREIQTEYNIKRNQKIDIIENTIDPMFIMDDQSAVSVTDISQRKKYVRAALKNGAKINDVLQMIPQTSNTYQLTEEINMLNEEYEKITGVNSVLLGHTSPSDRRAMGALQTVNAASSMRIEAMMQTLVNTMLQGYAEHFVELVWKYTSDEEAIALMEDESIIEVIGKAGNRKPLDFDISVNFGTTIANDTKLAQLNSLLQSLAQTQHASPKVVDKIIGRIYTIIMGETADETDVKTEQNPQNGGQNEPSEEEKNRAALAMNGV